MASTTGDPTTNGYASGVDPATVTYQYSADGVTWATIANPAAWDTTAVTDGIYQICTNATVGNKYTASVWTSGWSDSSCQFGSTDLKFWVGIDPKVIFLDEPTRGVDVASRADIYVKIEELAQKGVAVVLISSDLPEILRMSHRIIVMCEGRITGEVPSGATQEEIMKHATQRGETVAA